MTQPSSSTLSTRSTASSAWIHKRHDLGSSLPFLTLSMFFFFGIHNILQEAIMKSPGFRYGVMLGFFEVLGVTILSFVERYYIAQEKERIAPLSAYPILTTCLMLSSTMGNMSLNYINFPTKVVFRSCKLIPTMIIASFLHKRVFHWIEYLCALSICLGLVLFAAADWQTTPTFNPIGLLLVTLSVFMDAIHPNAQEKVFQYGASRLEVTLYNNFFTLIVMIVTTFLSGDLLSVFQLIQTDRKLTIYIAMYTVVSYFAVSSYISVIKKFGGVMAVLVATARKALTLIISFLLFPKVFSWYYITGAILTLGGIFVASSMKHIRKQKKVTIQKGHHTRLQTLDVVEMIKDSQMIPVDGQSLLDEEANTHHQHAA